MSDRMDDRMLGKLGSIITELVKFNGEVLTVLLDLLQKLNGRNSMELFKKLKMLLRNELAEVISYIISTHKFKVNYDRSIEDSVKAGNYDRISDSITDKRFSSSTESGVKEVEGAIYHFNKEIPSQTVIFQMERDGYRSATMKELLAFGEQNPELQRRFPIAALGSVAEIRGYRRVGLLDKDGSTRCFYLIFFDCDWSDHICFLAVRLPAQTGN